MCVCVCARWYRCFRWRADAHWAVCVDGSDKSHGLTSGMSPTISQITANNKICESQRTRVPTCHRFNHVMNHKFQHEHQGKPRCACICVFEVTVCVGGDNLSDL